MLKNDVKYKLVMHYKGGEIMPVKFDEESNVRDYLLGLDDLQQPKMIDMSIIQSGVMNSAILMIARLILLRKGTYADQPDMGVDIRANYRFAFESELTQLSRDIMDQCATYLPEFSSIQVNASLYHDKDNKTKVMILIMIDKSAYEILYDIDSQTIDGIKDK